MDRLRGVQGNYVASLANEPRNRAPDSRKPLHASRIHNFIDHYGGNSAVADGQKWNAVTYLLEPNTDIWNAGDVAGTLNMLQKYIQDPGVNEGNPYYSYFLEEGVPVGSPTSPQTIQPVFNLPGNFFVDHTFSYLKPSEDRALRDEGGIEITVVPVYNFYLDTMPAYEQVTMDIPEAILPNFYIFETELRNTGSQTYSPDYKNTLTLYAGVGNNPDRMEDWFVEVEGGYTENTTTSYYQAYVSSLAAIKSSEANYASLKTQYNNSSKNIAVLHSDIGAIQRSTRVESTTGFDDQVTSGLSFLPFYNIVTIGEDDYAATEGGTEDLPTKAENSFFSGLFNVEDFDAESFIDILQMYIITMIEKGTHTNAQFHEFSKNDNPSQTVVSASLYFDLSKRLGGAGSLPGVPSAYDGFEKYAEFLQERITENVSTLDDFSVDVPDAEGNQYWERDNVTLIRDYANDSGWVALGPPQPNLPNLPPPTRVYNPPDYTAVSDFYDKQLSGLINLPMRNFDQVLDNQGAFSETILYKIDKRVVNSAGNVVPNIVQTIYLSPKIAQGGPLRYIDSQVRYGVRYQYDIQQVRVVFGNEYQYDDLKIYFAGFAGYGRAVGNALGFYQAVVPEIVVDGYVQNLVSPYLAEATDTPYSTEQDGYFGVAPSNASNITIDDWNYMAQGSAFGETAKLSKINLVFKRGYGFLGNPDGGAVSGEYTGQSNTAVSSTGTTMEYDANAGDLIITIPVSSPVPGSAPGPVEKSLPGIEQITGFEELGEMTEGAGLHVLDTLVAEMDASGETTGLSGGGVGGVIDTLLTILAEVGGVVGGVGPIDGGHNLVGGNVQMEMGIDGGLNPSGINMPPPQSYSP